MLMLMLGPILAFEETVVRDMRPGTERRYRVKVEQEGGDEYAFRLKTKVVATKAPKGAKGEIRLDVRLTDYHATVGGQKVSARFMGGGEMPIEPTGVPGGLDVSGPQGPLWMPLVAFYLPTLEADGPVAMPSVSLSGLILAGKAEWKRPMLGLDATLSHGDRELGKLTFDIKLDKGGWPQKADGKLVSADGTYRFTLERA